MLNAEMLREAEQRRLAWRCRRGMLELDIVLQRFVKDCFNDLSLQEVEAFDGLLDLPDNAFWDLIKTDEEQQDEVLTSLVVRIKASREHVAKDY